MSRSYYIDEIRLLATQKGLKRILRSKDNIYLSIKDKSEVENILRNENIEFAFMDTGFDNCAIFITHSPHKKTIVCLGFASKAISTARKEEDPTKSLVLSALQRFVVPTGDFSIHFVADLKLVAEITCKSHYLNQHKGNTSQRLTLQI